MLGINITPYTNTSNMRDVDVRLRYLDGIGVRVIG